MDPMGYVPSVSSFAYTRSFQMFSVMTISGFAFQGIFFSGDVHQWVLHAIGKILVNLC